MNEDSLAGFDDVLDIYTERSTLSQLAARVDAYTPNVRVWVTAPAPSTAASASGGRVHVIALDDAIDDGTPMYFGRLDLASDTDRLADGIVSGFIDLGPLPESTNIAVQVQDELGLGNVRSHIIVDQCDIGRGTASCVEPGCTVEASVPIVAAGCMGAPELPCALAGARDQNRGCIRGSSHRLIEELRPAHVAARDRPLYPPCLHEAREVAFEG